MTCTSICFLRLVERLKVGWLGAATERLTEAIAGTAVTTGNDSNEELVTLTTAVPVGHAEKTGSCGEPTNRGVTEVDTAGVNTG